MERVTFKIKTLTPVWSGDVFGNSERLRQTSVLGSLRYMGEALLRSFGIFVCPTIGDSRSEIRNCIYRENNKSLCAGCYFWGATGWQRQFRFYLDGGYSLKTYRLTDFWLKQTLGNGSETVKMIDFPNTATVEFYPLNTFNAFLEELNIDTRDYLHLLMYVTSEFGTIGSKARTGLGFFEVVDGIDRNRVINAFRALKTNANKINTFLRNDERDPDFPNLANFVRYDFQINQPDRFLQKLTATLNTTNRGNINIVPRNINFKQFFEDMVNGWYIKYYIRKKIKSDRNIRAKYERLLGSREKGSLFYASCIYNLEGKPVFRVILEDLREASRAEFDGFIEGIFRPEATLIKKKLF